jgi:hypothetical protein
MRGDPRNEQEIGAVARTQPPAQLRAPPVARVEALLVEQDVEAARLQRVEQSIARAVAYPSSFELWLMKDADLLAERERRVLELDCACVALESEVEAQLHGFSPVTRNSTAPAWGRRALAQPADSSFDESAAPSRSAATPVGPGLCRAMRTRT